MKKISHLLITALIGFVIFSCSSNDDNNQAIPTVLKVTLPEDVTNEDAITIISEGIKKGMTRLYIENTTNLTELDLSQISALDTLQIFGNTGLKSMLLSNLETINALTVSGNDLLSSLNLQQLKSAGELNIPRNPLLETIDLPSLASVDKFSVYQSDSLTTLNLDALTEVTSRISIQDCSKLTSISLPSLIEAYEIRIGENESAINIELDELTIVNDELTIYRNNNLEALTLPKLTEVKGTMGITNNTKLVSMDLPSLTAIATTRPAASNEDDGGLYLSNNPLESIDIPNLEFTNYMYLADGIFSSINLPKLASAVYFQIESTTEITTLNLSSLQDFEFLDFRSEGNFSTTVIDELLNNLVNITPAITERIIGINGIASDQGLIDAETLRANNNTVNINQ